MAYHHYYYFFIFVSFKNHELLKFDRRQGKTNTLASIDK